MKYSKKNNNSLNFFHVALMFVGAIMGAGFASGRELWQFMGLFGNHGLIGTTIVSLAFVILGYMTSYIARRKNSSDFAKIITPQGHPKIEKAVSVFMSVMLFSVLLTMSAAGGALLYQNYGIHRAVGGAIICFFVTITVLGDFQRVSGVFKKIMPVLFSVAIVVSIIIIFSDFEGLTTDTEVKPAIMAPHWLLACLLYISYNILAMIPMISSASLHARNYTHAVGGAALGGAMIGILAFVIILAIQTNMGFSDQMDMPMLAYAQLLPPFFGIMYTCVLFVAIYSAATSNFYGFTTKIPQDPKKKKTVIIASFMAFLLGLFGFKNIVAYMFSAEGYFGFLIIGLLIVNYYQLRMDERRKKKYKKQMLFVQEESFFQDFPGHNRLDFPEPIVRVTGGPGGEALLILGTDKTALYDCGMACFNDILINNLKAVLGEEKRSLDYILLSHSHYDHIGALPYLLDQWPEAVVCGSSKIAEVFQRDNALNTMEKLGNCAAELYQVNHIKITSKGMRIDWCLQDGETISLGEETIVAYETKGHTDCSMSYLILPKGILLASESTGIQATQTLINISALKSYQQSFESAKKLKKIKANYIVTPHYGVLPEKIKDSYLDEYIKEAEVEKKIIVDGICQGKDNEEILRLHQQRYWTLERNKEQPFEAYRLNTEIIIQQLRNEIR